jgi:oxygen-dependent protoporphyrinogen oxidase
MTSELSGPLDTDVLVVGAGISGLVTAWRLQQAGRAVAVIEAAPRAGGAIGSLRADGCLVENGPNSTLETSPLIGQLLEETGAIGERIYANTVARKRFVLRGGRLIPIPMSPSAFLATPLFSARTKLSLVREPFIRPSAPDAQETVAQFVRRRLCQEFLDYAINPFVAGVYAGDPERLSVRAAFPRLFELEQKYGSLIRGQIAGARERKRNPEKSKQSAPMLSFRDGMQTMPDAIAGKLRRLLLGTRATGLARHPQGDWEITAETSNGALRGRARTVVLAVPAWVAATLVAPQVPAAAQALEAIHYPPVAAVASAYDRADIAHALDGFGFLVPEKERRRILGTIFSSTLFENRAPAGTALLTTFVGGMRQPELARLDDEAIARTVHDELANLVGVRAAPRWTRVSRWERAIPQYTPGHLDRMAALDAAERDLPGLYFCANYRGGISVADCIKSADAMAVRITEEHP